MTRPPQAVEVEADLRLDVDGHAATLIGSGADLTLFCAEPSALLGQLSYAPVPVGVGRVDGPRTLGRAAAALDRAGLRLSVTGPGGAVLVLGRGQDSRVGRLVTGSRRARFGSTRALRPVVAAEVVRRAQRVPGRAVLGGLALLAAAVVIARPAIRRR